MPTPQKPPLKLFWCATESGRDGFVVARSEPQARRIHEGESISSLFTETDRDDALR